MLFLEFYVGAWLVFTAFLKYGIYSGSVSKEDGYWILGLIPVVNVVVSGILVIGFTFELIKFIMNWTPTPRSQKIKAKAEADKLLDRIKG